MPGFLKENKQSKNSKQLRKISRKMTRFNPSIFHVPNLMQMRKSGCFGKFALNCRDEKFEVCNGLESFRCYYFGNSYMEVWESAISKLRKHKINEVRFSTFASHKYSPKRLEYVFPYIFV